MGYSRFPYPVSWENIEFFHPCSGRLSSFPSLCRIKRINRENNPFYLKKTYLCSQLKKFHFTLKLKTNLITFSCCLVSISLADCAAKLALVLKKNVTLQCHNCPLSTLYTMLSRLNTFIDTLIYTILH